VAGRDALGADLAGGEEQLIELEVVVAERTGDGSSAGEVVGDEGADDLVLEAVLGVDEVIRNVEVLCDAASVVNIINRAAAALDGLGHAGAASEAALVPELKGEADDGVSLGVEQRSGGGGVDAAGHGHGDEVWRLQSQFPL